MIAVTTNLKSGDYSAVPGTLIGALATKLGLSVRNLAKNKDVDLRVNFNCWVSGYLPDNMPFNRLVCFESGGQAPHTITQAPRYTIAGPTGSKYVVQAGIRFASMQDEEDEKLPAQISSIFRAMMPIFNDKEMTVITPLLAAGNQGHAEDLALRSIVTASCNWIRAGLPLKCLKIVVYTNNPASLSPAQNDLLEIFSKLQKKWKDIEQTKKEKKYDVCISFCKEDNTLAEQIRKGLQKFDSSIVVYSEDLVHDYGQVWQEEIFDIMIHSRRVVAVLTPDYIAQSECLEQYNIALCCNRLTSRDILTPFYMKTVDMLPSYMTLVQYTECRVRHDGETAEGKIITACSLLIKHLDADMQTEPTSKTSHHNQDEMNSNYDVFISYAHKNPELPHHLHRALQDADPDMKIFFDTSELRAGKIWQEALYEAVDQAKCVIAMLSSAYFNSTVCQEEYNIALARFLSQDGIILIPVLAEEDVEEIPASFSVVPILDMRSSRRADQITLARIIDKWLCYKKPDLRFSRPSHPLPFQNVLEAWRMKDFNNRFIFNEVKSN
ncbi:hypothetical protein C0Q70_07782 [Pomacea canaliculata]|uniref:ADP-ribosyl cyclase/cyclic ADP-ribose hydrolase n=1 Tax=Pomacea canaliculata TaxID=400727 RepID=A0A2T7PG08_POMCA|nr:hypothetical protein C0Q70_07782 [Pomacea canaliculata]